MIYNDISRMLYPNLNVIGVREEFRENSRSGLAAVGRVYKQPVSAPRHALIRNTKRREEAKSVETPNDLIPQKYYTTVLKEFDKYK